MILQIPELYSKLGEYGLLGMAVGILGFVVYKLYTRNMALVERTLTMYDDERASSKETEAEYKEYLKEVIKTQTVALERNSAVIEEYTLTYKHLLSIIDNHMGCSYNPGLKRKE